MPIKKIHIPQVLIFVPSLQGRHHTEDQYAAQQYEEQDKPDPSSRMDLGIQSVP